MEIIGDVAGNLMLLGSLADRQECVAADLFGESNMLIGKGRTGSTPLCFLEDSRPFAVEFFVLVTGVQRRVTIESPKEGRGYELSRSD